jgi:hypothetical protein
MVSRAQSDDEFTKSFRLGRYQYEEIVRLRPWTAADIYEMKALANKKVGVVKIATARPS